MRLSLRVLHLEDNREYSELIQKQLEVNGLIPEFCRVETRADFEAALIPGQFDLILADYRVPGYAGLEAVRTARARLPTIPILVLSGTVGEEAAVDCFKAGATDYLLKHWPERLIPAIRRALGEASERSQRLHAEAALTQREKLFRALSDNALDLVTVLDQEGKFVYNSPSVTRILGYTAEFLVGRSAFDYTHPDDLAQVQRDFMLCAQSGEQTIISKFRARHQDGSWHYLETHCRSLLNDPEIAGVVVNSRDITQRHRMEVYNSALTTLGLKLSSAISAEEAAKVIVETAEKLCGWDCCTLNLYSAEEEKMHPVLSIDTIGGRRQEIPSTQIDKNPTTRTRRIVSGKAELVLRDEPLAISSDGIGIGDKSRPSASLMFVPIRNGSRVIGVLSIQSYELRAYDQTDLATLQALADYCGGALERIRVEEALRQTEKRFRQLFEDSPDAIFVEDFGGKVLDANAEAVRIQGLPREELIGKNVADLVPSRERGKLMETFHKLVEGELSQVEGVTLTADGREIPVDVRTSLIHYAGKPALLLHVRDISERKRAEEAEIRFQSVWENSVDGMRLTDEEGLIVAVNDSFCRLVGMERKDLQGKPYTVAYAWGAEEDDKLAVYRARFQDGSVQRRIERKITFRSGRTVDLEAVTTFVESRGQKRLLLGLFRDVTEQKLLEEQLRHSQKMEAVGQLAGGIAHDFNNILTIIQGHAGLLRAAPEIGESLGMSATQISEAADRAANLTRQLLTFSRRQMMQPRRLDLNVVVSNLTKMLARILGEDIALQFKYSDPQPLVHADEGMIEQVLMNFAVNSRDAMPVGGELIIRIGVEEISAESVREHPDRRGGSHVCLSVTDTGCGIDATILPRIFEPFFTTKAIGKGTGLGLATVYGIVKQHRGWIEVDSQIGEGATFRVYLPSAVDAAAVPRAAEIEATPRTTGTETILVVEDEPSVRELVCRLLRGCGYRVLQATSGLDALKVWRIYREQIHLLLTDLVMPDGMTGRELADKIVAEKPSVKVIFTSGYSADTVGKDFVLQEDLNFLQKPYLPQKLVRVVRKCLDNP